jgi:drug/metabolite transporter (DMT)-like permease
MKNFIIFVLLPVLLTAIGEFFFKASANMLPAGNIQDILLWIIHPGIFVGMVCVVGGGILWIIAMSRYELSFLYPFLCLNYVLVLIGSYVFLGEQVTVGRIIAASFVIVGLLFISRSRFTT